MQLSSARAGARRAVAASTSGIVVAGLAAVAVVGAASSASADTVAIEGDFDYICAVTVGPRGDVLPIGDYEVGVALSTTAEVPLVPLSTQAAHPASITLSLPAELQRASQTLNAEQIEGFSDDSSTEITLPTPFLGAGNETQTETIPLIGLSAPKQDIPPLGQPWEITSTGTVPEVKVPGFAGNNTTFNPSSPQDSTYATLAMPENFTIKSTFYLENGSTTPSKLDCTLDSDPTLGGPAPVSGPLKTDSVDVEAETEYNEPVTSQLVFFNITQSGVNNSFTQPEHGTVTPGAGGQFTYTPDEGYAGEDSYTYTAADASNPTGITSTVSIKVKKAESIAGFSSTTVIRYGQSTTYNGRVVTEGTRGGTARLVAGGKIVDTATVLADGRISLTLPARTQNVGQRSVQIRYTGTPTVQGFRENFSLKVTKAATMLRAKDVTVKAGKQATIAVTAGPANARVAGNLQATINGNGAGRAKLVAGQGRLTLRAVNKPGTYNVRVQFKGSANAKAASTVVQLTVKK